MKTIACNPFLASLRDPIADRFRRAVGRELASHYADVLSEPVPSELRGLIQALEDPDRLRPSSQATHLKQEAPRHTGLSSAL
jgi:hypothetical protein